MHHRLGDRVLKSDRPPIFHFGGLLARLGQENKLRDTPYTRKKKPFSVPHVTNQLANSRGQGLCAYTIDDPWHRSPRDRLAERNLLQIVKKLLHSNRKIIRECPGVLCRGYMRISIQFLVILNHSLELFLWGQQFAFLLNLKLFGRNLRGQSSYNPRQRPCIMALSSLFSGC